MATLMWKTFQKSWMKRKKGRKSYIIITKWLTGKKDILKITIGGVLCLLLYMVMSQKCIYNTNVYFKNTYESEWMESSLAKEMIKDIDKFRSWSCSECIVKPGFRADTTRKIIRWCKNIIADSERTR